MASRQLQLCSKIAVATFMGNHLLSTTDTSFKCMHVNTTKKCVNCINNYDQLTPHRNFCNSLCAQVNRSKNVNHSQYNNFVIYQNSSQRGADDNMTISNLTRLRTTLTGFTLASSLLLSCSVSAAEEGESDGNRYFLERYYLGEISSAQTFMEAVVKKGKLTDRSDKLIILDVRDATEYKLGHPEGAYHFPYPRIYRECVNDDRPEDGGGCNQGTVQSYSQDPEDLFKMVEEKFPNKSQRLATLCRTGFRSVLAANILSKPEEVICDLKYSGVPADFAQCQSEYEGRGYNRVSNIWQGFVGQTMAGILSQSGTRYVVGDDQTLQDLTLPDGSAAKGFIAFDLDLNNDEAITAADKDGWRYHQGLPYDTRLLPKLKNEDVDAMGFYDLP